MAREKHQASQKENKQLSLKVDELERLEALGSNSVLFLGPETCSRLAALGLVCCKVLGRSQRKSCFQRSGKHCGRGRWSPARGDAPEQCGQHHPPIGPPVRHTWSKQTHRACRLRWGCLLPTPPRVPKSILILLSHT